MAADLVRYFAWQLTMWVFSFKYWVVSIEMPKAIQSSLTFSYHRRSEETQINQGLVRSERKYMIVLWVGIIINSLAIVVYIFLYGKLCMTHENKGADIIAYSFINFCGLVSSCFLGDALRRIYNTLK